MNKRSSLCLLLVLFPVWLFASTAITVTDITDHRIYQRDIGGTTCDIVLSGTYTGDAPASVQGKVVASTGHAEVLAYADLTSTTIAGGTWTGTINNVPQGGMYHIYVQGGGVSDENNTNEWGVGILVGTAGGQSNGVIWWTPFLGGGATLTPNALLSYYAGSWSHPSYADGACAFANKIIEATGIPVGILTYAVNGRGLTSGCYDAVTDYWLDESGAAYSAFKSAVTAVGGTIEYNVMVGGESDAFTDVAAATYKSGLSTFFTRLKTDCGNADLRFLISGLGRHDGTYGGTDAGWTGILTAQQDWCAETTGAYFSASNMDHSATLQYNVHFDGPGSILNGQRIAQTLLKIMGEEPYYRGPRISAITKYDNTHADVTIIHRGGSSFTPTTGITGFRVFEGGESRVVSAAVLVDGTTIRLTTAELGSGALTLDYQYGMNATISGAVKDNSSMALPLEMYSSDYPISDAWDETVAPAATSPRTHGPITLKGAGGMR